jgi:hypothetical protein
MVTRTARIIAAGLLALTLCGPALALQVPSAQDDAASNVGQPAPPETLPAPSAMADQRPAPRGLDRYPAAPETPATAIAGGIATGVTGHYQTQWRTWDQGGAAAFSSQAALLPSEDPTQPYDCARTDTYCFHLRNEVLAWWRERWEGGKFVERNGDTVIDRQDFDSKAAGGSRLALALYCGDCTELEIGGFWISNFQSGAQSRGENNLNMPVFGAPLGFEDFGRDASRIRVEYESRLAGFDLTLRHWDPGSCSDPRHYAHRHETVMLGCVPLAVALECGLRYLKVDEDFSVLSQAGPVPSPTGENDFRYITLAKNHLLGPQAGIQVDTGNVHRLDFAFSLRGMIAANFVHTDVRLNEKKNALLDVPGAVAFDENRDEVSFSQVLEAAALLRWQPCSAIEVHVGYQALWINGYAGAPDQFNRDLSEPGQYDDDNSVLLHGWVVGLEITF